MWLYAEGMSKSRHYPGGRATTLKPAFEPIVLARRELRRDHRGDDRPPRDRRAQRRGLPGRGPPPGQRDPRARPRLRARSAARRAVPSPPPTPAPSEGRSPRSRRAASSTARRRAGPSATPAASSCRRRALDLFPNADRAARSRPQARNPHPTVKPLELMRWLVRLLCPPGGLVLDPTAGSGTTGAAAVLEGRRFCRHRARARLYGDRRRAHRPPRAARPGEAEGEPRPFREAAVSATPAEERASFGSTPESIEALARRLAELLAPRRAAATAPSG